MYLSCSCLVCDQREYPGLPETLAKIRELGFRAFDLDAFENWQHVNPSDLAEADDAWMDGFAATLAGAQMRASSFNCGLSGSLTDGDSFARCLGEFLALLDLAEEVGCENLTVQPGTAGEGQTLEAALETAAENLSELSEMARLRGISVGVEAHQGSILEAPEVALRFVRELCPSVGLTYDPSHFAMQDIALPDTEPLLDHTVHVHVRNASPGKMQDTMDRGVVDFAWLVSALKARGYAGALAIEYFNGFDEDFRSTLALRDLLVDLGVAP